MNLLTCYVNRFYWESDAPPETDLGALIGLVPFNVRPPARETGGFEMATLASVIRRRRRNREAARLV